MSRFIIKGRRTISGALKPVGNKNAVLPMLAASVLTDESVTLNNVPRIEDVRVMLALLDDLGVEIEERGRRVTVCAAGLRKRTLDPDLCRRVRSSVLLAGPMAARHGRVTLYPPGGDVIGRRRMDTHFDGLQALGIRVRAGTKFVLQRQTLRGAEILLDEASVTATENILMAAVLAPGRTTIFNAACEPHVADLGKLLIKMGARIGGLGTNRITVNGVTRLRGARHRVSPDYIEVGSYMAAAAVTGGQLEVGPLSGPDFQPVISRVFAELGAPWTRNKSSLLYAPPRHLNIRKDIGSAIPKIEDGPWPSFPSDLMSVALVLATQARGTVLFFEKMFESRLYFVDQLSGMGAQIVQCDPHRVVVVGPHRLHGAHIFSPDIRAGMALIVAALCARGESVIENAPIIDRGYESVDDRLRALGADIERVE